MEGERRFNFVLDVYQASQTAELPSSLCCHAPLEHRTARHPCIHVVRCALCSQCSIGRAGCSRCSRCTTPPSCSTHHGANERMPKGSSCLPWDLLLSWRAMLRRYVVDHSAACRCISLIPFREQVVAAFMGTFFFSDPSFVRSILTLDQVLLLISGRRCLVLPR